MVHVNGDGELFCAVKTPEIVPSLSERINDVLVVKSGDENVIPDEGGVGVTDGVEAVKFAPLEYLKLLILDAWLLGYSIT
jgi:hypothetical protein